MHYVDNFHSDYLLFSKSTAKSMRYLITFGSKSENNKLSKVN